MKLKLKSSKKSTKGDTRTLMCFAWIPTTTNDKYVIWLEVYCKLQEYTESGTITRSGHVCQNLVWKTIKKYVI